jgi:feruloyl esterase
MKITATLTIALAYVGVGCSLGAPALANGSEPTGLDCTLQRVATMVSAPVSIESARPVAATALVPAHCAISGFIEHGSRIGFTLALPSEWNHKFLFFGVGGFAGVPAPLDSGIARGYATGSTDTGHKGTSVEDATWALNNSAAVLNHYESSVELAATALKELTSSYYGARPAHAYFQGCSAGGRQALVEAERFPGTFDGIVAEAPAWSYSKLLVSFMENAREILKSPDNWVPPEAFPAIDREVLRQCDALDGLEDGIIEDPRACKPDLRRLLCPNPTQPGKTATCLTRAQVAILQKLVNPEFARGRPGYYGYYLTGSERSDLSWGWSEWFFGTLPPLTDARGKLNFRGDVLPPGPDRGKGPNQFLLGEQFFRYMVMNDPGYDARTFELGRDGERLQHRLGGLLDADSADLGPFVRSGGKLLIWHGWSDPAIPPSMAIELYTRILHETRQAAGQLSTAEAVRLFMVPGVQHCGGGAGLTEFDPLAAMEQWAEQGHAPDRITAWQRAGGQRVRSRPLCAYPKTPLYHGSGNPDDAANFRCE